MVANIMTPVIEVSGVNSASRIEAEQMPFLLS
jgi:hypothetical protein